MVHGMIRDGDSAKINGDNGDADKDDVDSDDELMVSDANWCDGAALSPLSTPSH